MSACVSPPVEAPQSNVEQQTDVSTDQNAKNKVDLLFMVDDSGSMAPKQNELKSRFPQFIAQLDSFAASGHSADYHIGVVTSSLGAPGYAGTCSNLGGKLQKRGLAKTNTAGCTGPTGNYMVYNQLDHTQDNFDATQGAAATFSCMASVVDPSNTQHTGCGFESQLESVYTALHDTSIVENKGFLRDDAILAIIWVTDEDDCSVDSSSDLFSNPSLGPVNSYRCAQNGIVCDGMLLPSVPQASFANCAPATYAQSGKRETDLEKYVTYFTQSNTAGGVKADPRDVILAAITAPADPVGSYTATGSANCGTLVGGGQVTTCTNISHSCTLDTDPTNFFGDPAQRLRYVVGKAQNHAITSICDNSYATALAAIGQKIVNALQPSCLTSPLKLVTVNGSQRPDCIVQDVTNTSGVVTRNIMPFCPDAPGMFPCWETKDNVQCAAVCDPQSATYVQTGINVNRNGAKAPANTTADVSCNTIAIANADPDAICLAAGHMPPTTGM
ncbi:MAG: hypothetical protein ABI321_18180 [Polyangia bacterium]